MNIFNQFFGGEKGTHLKNIINASSFLVDVRTPEEFAKVQVKGSVNIPLDTILSQLPKFKGKENIIVFCRTGNRSSQAKSILEQHGFLNVFNGGSIENVNRNLK